MFTDIVVVHVNTFFFAKSSRYNRGESAVDQANICMPKQKGDIFFGIQLRVYLNYKIIVLRKRNR